MLLGFYSFTALDK